ncbi:MAG: hypothetical protein DI582_05160 [Azospirillum brasilense]|nr:MAG: hypothetical protein DI582_05160 [Azospirillum brasilense]
MARPAKPYGNNNGNGHIPPKEDVNDPGRQFKASKQRNRRLDRESSEERIEGRIAPSSVVSDLFEQERGNGSWRARLDREGEEFKGRARG